MGEISFSALKHERPPIRRAQFLGADIVSHRDISDLQSESNFFALMAKGVTDFFRGGYLTGTVCGNVENRDKGHRDQGTKGKRDQGTKQVQTSALILL
jgi:hypothetical protein